MTNRTVKSVCPYCGVGCGIVMEVEGERVVRVSGDKAHPANFGRLCTKGSTCAQAIAVPGRMDRAYVRRAGQDQAPVPVNDAIAEAARRLCEIRDRDGADAIGLYVSGQMSLEAQYLATKLAKGYLRTAHLESNSRLCMASAGSGYKLSLGSDGPPGSYEDFDRADVFLVIGANMADCHPILFLRMMDRVKAGAKLIVVDPRRTATAEKADLFLQIAPGTDLALLNGVLHLLVANGQTDADFIARHTDGWEGMTALLADYAPARVAEICGLAEGDLRQAADWIGGPGAFMSCWTMGLNQSTHGTWNTNAVCNLHLATGKICQPGSGPFSLTGQPNAMGGREMGYMGAGLPGQRSAEIAGDRAFIEGLWGLAAGTLRANAGHLSGSGGAVDLFQALRDKAVKACWIICTNPVASMANRGTVIAGLEAAELVITQDAFLDTETNVYADIMLPGALWAEAEGVMVNSERNLTLMAQAVAPPGEALADWEIIARVACAMGYAEGFTFASAAAVFEELKQAANPKTGYDISGASHARLRERPLQWPIAAGDGARNPIRYRDGDGLGFATENGRARFFARPHGAAAELPDAAFPFVLNTGRLQHQWHTLTKTGKVATLNKLNPGPFVEIHPADAAALGIAAKDPVEVRSARGRAVLPAAVSDRVRPGACFTPFHWNDVFGEELAINAVTNDAVDPISLQPEFKVCAVALARVGAAEVIGVPGDMTRIQSIGTMLGLGAAPAVALGPDERLYLQGFLAGLGADGAVAGVPVLPASAPVSAETRLVLDGMLAGMFSRAAGPVAAEAAAGAVLVLWASQIGRSEGFAAVCQAALAAAGHRVRVAAMDGVTAGELAAAPVVLLLASTFGDGEAPDNGVALWEALRGEAAPRLEGTRFAVLAFGDSSYDQFCGFGRALDARLAELGGQRLVPRVDCEPEYETAAQGWLDAVMTALGATPVAAAAAAAPVGFTRAKPLLARLVGNRLLNGAGAEKETRQFIFDLGDSGFRYDVGDALGVWPRNDPALVANFLATLGLADDAPVMVAGVGEMALAAALATQFEITKTTPEMLRFVAERSGSSFLIDLMLEERRTHRADWLWGRQFIDLLHGYPIETSADELVGVLKRMQPRLYSIASSPRLCPTEVHLTVSTVRYGSHGAQHGGVCSTFLADRAAEAPIFVQKTTHFRPPQDPAQAMIMVGPGTGVAPFRAFLQERQAVGATGRNWLFFGEQRAATDFYYRDEFEAMRSGGFLHRLDTAFSRDQAEKIYVQNRMIEQGAQLWAWLQEGAHFYVCGDASRMAKDVDAALRRVIEVHGGLRTEEADAYVSAMTREKRYVRDVY